MIKIMVPQLPLSSPSAFFAYWTPSPKSSVSAQAFLQASQPGPGLYPVL